MTSVEKRRSGRKSGGHRKHSDGGYSDTSSSGSFLDETDREVSNLTDRAFRSLCIGDEAVYNDSDLCSSSPCSQKDRQLAFSQSGQDRDRGDREREELKRAAHESFTLRVQQYGQDWIHGGMYGAEIQREVYGERTQGRVSATFQHSFVETSQQEKSLREEQLSFLSNGATELSSQQRRSRSRVSSLIRVFNSEGNRVEPGDDGKLREWNDDTSWDRSALMSIQKELSEFSTPYQQNFTNDHFPSAGPFSSKDTSFYSSQVAAVAHMNSASSLMSASHSKHSMSTQVNCNSNFFIHSEFSPFKLWRDHNRFPFHQGEVSGFMQCSEFPKWYETPMYKELSLEAQPQGPYRLEERSIRHPRNDMAPMASPTPPHSTSLSAMLQKASAVEKRSESEVAGHYPQRKQMQGLGANRFPSKRPSTASPTTEMSRRVQDTISSVKALKEKIKMMTEENMETEMTANQQGVLCSNDNLIPFGNNVLTVAPNVTKSNTSTTPFSISQLLTPSVHAHQEAETSEVRQCAVSPQPVEHPPVRAESRGATPDVRMSSYKSRATSLLFNLKDNRKRVKNTYSPAKFKALEKPEKNKQPSIQEPRDTVIDIPEFPDPDIQLTEIEESNRTNPALHHYVNQYQSLGLSHTMQNSQSASAHADQYSEYTLSHYQTAQMQGEMVHHSRFTGFIPENCSTNQLANGQNPHEDLMSFTPYKQGMIDNVETLGGDVYRFKSSYTATETPRQKAENNQTSEHFISKASAEQHCIETVGMEIAKMDRYQQLKENKHNYSNLSSQDRWRQTNSQDTEKHSRKADISPWKQEITALIERDQHTQAYQREATIKEELNVPRDKYRGENQQNMNKELEKVESRQSFGVGTSSHKSIGLVNPNISNQLPQYAPFSNDPMENQYYGLYQPGAIRHKCVPQKYYGYNAENEMKENILTHNYTAYTDQEYQNKHSLYSNKDNRETDQRKQYIPVPKGHEIEQARPQFEHDMQRKSLANHNNAAATVANQVKDRLSVEVKAEQATAEHIKAQHTQAELAKAQHWAQVEQPKAESARLILADQTGSEKVKAEQSKAKLTEHEIVQQAKAEHIKEEERKGVQAEQSREKQPEQGRVEKTKVEQTTVQKLAEEPKNFTEEAGAMHMKEEQVKAEQAVVERLKEEHIKSELAKTEKTRIQQAVQAKRAKIKLEQIAEEQLRAEQIEREQREAEQIRTENIKAEQVETEHRKEEEAKQEQLKDQDKTEQEKMNLAEMMKVKADNIKFKDVRQEKAAEDSIQAGQANAEKLTTQISKAKPDLTKIEQTKLDLVGVELTKPENLQDRLAKPATKLSVIQHVKNEPDKVEQVKTELAKAKAELAKIKEKMRGEQKEKVRNTIIIKEDDITKIEVPLSMNINKNEEYIKQDQATQIHQQKEDSVYRRNSRDSRADDYDYLREKYGITNAVSTNRNYVSAAGNDSSNEANETPTVNTEEMKVGSLKSNNVIGGHYVYSEFSKEFKLSSTDDLPTHLDNIANCDTVIDKVEDYSVENLEKGDPKKPTDVSQQRDSDLTRLPPLERKPKSSEHSVGPVKALPFPPPRALSHKEKAQSKQEILTSKIKAHAEKEISAIKEKGFAIRDGFMSKNHTKQLIDSQSINVWHRPQTQEMSKKHETTVFSHSTPKHQMEPLGIQVEPVKCVSSQSSATMSITSAPTTGKLVDYSQKQVPKELVKSNENVTEPPRDATQIRSNGKMIDDGLVENPTKENQSGINSPMQSIEQAPKNNQGKQRTNHGENYGKKKEGLEENSATSTDHLNEKKQDTSQVTSLDKAESFKPMTTEKPESKFEAVHEDSASSPNLQIKTPVADNSLQIMGIMVTVREREQSENNGHRDNSTQEKINTKEEECSNSELNKSHPSSGAEVSKRNKSSEEVSIAKAKDSVVQETHPTVKEDQTEFGMNNHSENVQESSTLETRENHVSENITEKRTNLQESSSINAEPHSETQLQEQLAEKGLPSSVPAKNNVLAETQPLQSQDIITREMKDSSNKTPKENPAKEVGKDEVKRNMEEKIPQETHTNENFIAKVVNTQINCNNDSNGVDAEALVKHEAQLSVTENMTPVKNPAKSMSTDGKSAPLTEEKTHDLTPLNPLNRTSPSQQLTENQNSPVSPTLQYKKTHIGEYNQVDDGVHKDSIAIKVVQAVTEKDNLKMAGKHHVTTVPSDIVVSHEHIQVASSSSEEKVNTSNNEGRTEGNKSGEQYALSSVRKESDSLEISNQQNSVTAPTENTQDENRKPENVKENGKSVDESKIQAMEGGYFQVQGVAETNNEPHNSAYFVETLDGVLKGGELPELLPYKSTLSNKSDKEVKYGAFVLDQSKRKTAESSPVCVQNENTEKEKNSEPQDKLVSKHSDVPSEKKSNNDTMEAGQAHHIRKDHIVSQSSLSARERQSSRNSQATKENAVKEKPEVKPKPKERVSTVPEISALADYARLKVIVSEERANTIQELPPNKKEGFFPLIQTRYGRRPVFTAVPKDISVNEKSLPNKTEVSAKVKKEPKALVFPITEKEHQRTGMFKLGDKERQEKMVVNASGALDAGPQNAQCLKERNKSPTTCFKNQEKENQVAGTDTQRLCQEQSIHQPENPPVQASTSSPRVNRPRSASVSQHLMSLDNSNPYEKPEEFSSKAEKIPFFYPQPTSGQVYNLEESPTTLRKREKIENKLAKIREERKEKLRRERLDTQHEETTGQQLEEEQLSVMEVEKKHMKEESKASLAEEERRATQREEERRAKEREAITIKIRERWEKLREKDRRAVGERKAKQIEADGAAQKEEIRAQQKEEERRVKEAEERRIKNEEERREKLKKEDEEKRRLKQQEEERATQVEQQRKAALEEQQRRDAQEKQRKRAELQEEQRKAALKEQQRRAELEEQQRRAAVKEQQRRAAQEEQQRRTELEEQQRRAAVKEQQRRAAQEEQQRRAEQEEQQRRAELEEQQRRAELQEEQRKAAVKEQQRRAAQEEQQRRAAVKEQQRRAAQEEQQRRAELQRRAAQEEQQRRAAQEEQHQRAALEEEQRKAALKEQQRRAAVNEQQRRATPLEQLRRAELEEQQRKSDIEEQQWRPALEEEQQRAALEEQKKRAEQREQQMRAAQKEKKRIAALKEQQQRAALIEEQMQAKQIEEKILTETGEEKKRTQREEEGRKAEKEKAIIKQGKEGMTRQLEENQAAIKEEEKTVAREWPQSQREDEVRAKKTEAEEKSAGQREKETDTQMEEQKRAVQRTDSLQYYAITSTESERKPKERQLCSPSPSQQRKTLSRVESIEDSGPHTRPFRPHGAASPAPSLPRSNTSSPALGVKPSMFRVKDNTIRGFSFTKSVKPRFHKNFGGDFRVGSPMDRGFERGEEEQEMMRRSAGIPDRLAAIKELSTFQPSFSSQDYSAHLPQHRPYSRRSIVLDEDDSRSIFSNISEDVESFATTVDLADVRGLYDYERPESACSFSSDVSRSLGKPPVVPPKSEKALRRAKRLTTRRIKKELCKAAADSPAGVEKPLQEVSSIPPSTATEVRSSNCHAVASPHFSSPVSLAHAPALGSSLPSSHTEHQASRRSVHASPHATGPISLPAASPHATAPVTLPVAPSHATGPASRTAAPKTVAHVPSSPTFHHANHPAPVTQYHVESGYPQTYPLTQRKVLQDVGSGQYFVVDVPVQVKTKTFFDPETGKYVKLNVRESGQSTSQPQPQQTYPKPQLQSQIQVKPQQPLSRASPAGKPFVLYQGYNDYSQGYQPAGMNLLPPHRSSDPVTLHQDKQPFRENCSYGHSAPEIRQDSEEHRYSPEKTPYMDTVNDTEKTYNTVYNTHGSHEAFPECDTNSQLAVSSVCENDNSAHSPYQPRDIITMSELEDFMEVSDW